MNISDLSSDDQNTLAADEKLIRSVIIQFVNALKTAKIVQAEGIARTRNILNQLDTGTLIPNTTNLAGAGAITKEEFLSLLNGIDTALTNHYDPATSLPLYAKTCGAANIV